MTFKPAHKDTDNPPGQIINQVGEPHHIGGRTDAPIDRLQTIGGIIDRVMRSEAKPIKQKLNFEQWYLSWYYPALVGKMDVEEIAFAAWQAAQENV